jgi:hypothetical protein
MSWSRKKARLIIVVQLLVLSLDLCALFGKSANDHSNRSPILTTDDIRSGNYYERHCENCGFKLIENIPSNDNRPSSGNRCIFDSHPLYISLTSNIGGYIFRNYNRLYLVLFIRRSKLISSLFA